MKRQKVCGKLSREMKEGKTITKDESINLYKAGTYYGTLSIRDFFYD